MKAVIICPAERPEVIHLGESAPLVNHVLCGKPFIFYWIEFLAARGAKEIDILASDRPDMVRQIVEDGARWGVSINVIPERDELSAAQARARYVKADENALPAPHDAVLIDHLPNTPHLQPFSSYANFFKSAMELMPKAQSPDRIGLREVAPGIWLGLHTRIPSTARLYAPCWIGDNVQLGENAEVGPFASVESCSVIEHGASVSHSIVPPGTFVGPDVSLNQSLIADDTLIHWQQNSSIKVADRFLFTNLQRPPRRKTTNLLGRIAALVFMVLTAPLAFLWILVANLRAQPVLRQMQAVDPFCINPTRRTVVYYEFVNCTGIWQRWPQLWNIMRGEFAWVGNRPLNIIEAGQFMAEFEKLWFKAPIGLVSYADAEGCFDKLSDQSRVHACFYATQASTRLDMSILWKVMVGCGKRNVTEPLPVRAGAEKPNEMALRGTPVR